MLVPEQLIRLSARDQQVTWLDPLIISVGLSQAIIDIAVDSAQVPLGRMFILSHASMDITPGGGAQVFTQQIRLHSGPPPNLLPFVTLKQQLSNVPLAGDEGSLDWDGHVYLMPGQFLRARATLSSGVPVHTINLQAWGILVPIANVQR